MFNKAVIVALTLMFTGCAGVNLQQAGARTAIEVATLKYIDGNNERAGRVYAIASELIEETQNDTEKPLRQTLDRIESKARERIEWNQLDEAEALVVHRVIDAARTEVEHRVKQGTVNESARVAIRTVLKWIRDISQLSGGSNGGQFQAVGGNAFMGFGRAAST